MGSLVERHPNRIQVPLVVGGYLLAVIYGRQLHTLTPPFETIPPSTVSSQLYTWSTVQFGLALVVLGLVLSNRSVFHRMRVFRLSRAQRLGAAGCAFLLVSPWMTAIVAGIALKGGDPFTTLWFIAFLGGFAGMGGLLLVGLLRVAQMYVTPSEQFPYVGVDLSRREVIRGGVFAILGGGAVASTFAVGRVSLGASWPAYHGRAPVVYERDDLGVQAVEDPVRLGESITFEVTNTATTESVGLGCHNPWALQAYEDGSWHHVTWTEGRYYWACATILQPGGTTTATVPLSEAAITDGRETLSDPARELTPGTYRLVLLGPNPYLAVNFQVLPS